MAAACETVWLLIQLVTAKQVLFSHLQLRVWIETRESSLGVNSTYHKGQVVSCRRRASILSSAMTRTLDTNLIEAARKVAQTRLASGDLEEDYQQLWLYNCRKSTQLAS